MRGNPAGVQDADGHPRSIPASAGEPVREAPEHDLLSVYPRECGGTSVTYDSSEKLNGLSPRVRGEPTLAPPAFPVSPVYPRECGGTARKSDTRPTVGGSIPASAGEPDSTPTLPVSSGVYPRECGGTRAPHGATPQGHGLSPRVRGNLRRSNHRQYRARSIPANAGEPGDGYARLCVAGSIPASAGGTLPVSRDGCSPRGLSRECGGTPAGQPVLSTM